MEMREGGRERGESMCVDIVMEMVMIMVRGI